jgi:transposase-like protein
MVAASVNWHLRYSLSPRDVEKLLIDRGVSADHTTVWCWEVCG